MARNIVPRTDKGSDLGTPAKNWGKVYAGQVIADTVQGGNLGAVEQSAGDETTLRSLIASSGSNPISITVYNDIPITSTNLTIPSNIRLRFKDGGKLSPASGITLTINGSIEAGLYQIFDGSGTITSDGYRSNIVYPEWFGAMADGTTDDTESYNKSLTFLPNGGTIFFQSGATYRISSKQETPDYLTIIAYGATIRSIDGVDTGNTIGLHRTSGDPCMYSAILGGIFDGNWGTGSEDDPEHLPGTNTALSFGYSSHCLLRDCTIINAVNDGIAGAFLSDCVIENCFVENSAEHNFYCSFSENIKLINCRGKNPNQNNWGKGGVFVKFRECTHMLVDGFTGSVDEAHRCSFQEGSGQYFIFKNIYVTGLNAGFYYTSTPASLGDLNGPFFFDSCRFIFSVNNTAYFLVISGADTLYKNSEYNDIYIANTRISILGLKAKNIHIVNSLGNINLDVKYIEDVLVEDSAGYTLFNISNRGGSVIKNYKEIGNINTSSIRIYGDNTHIENMLIQRSSTLGSSRINIYGTEIKIKNSTLGSCDNDIITFENDCNVTLENISVGDCRFVVTDNSQNIQCDAKDIKIKSATSVFYIRGASTIIYGGILCNTLTGNVVQNNSGGTATITPLSFR